ncbi:polysaccharide pyruvyl transferase family protein [Gordonia hankookensis]|uniref:Polysaccharide pyruvyl transferase family protein n=1 Tax=Gordonia hankookensis TaxID=589403 RepID=A0ABR7WHE9_9ACTN|nr:polysaccharide pyruvyl transferase family protein [Gordonia hankookensis]MBD1322006.1 polysaccharide pyruvyl transferase family protein [Gordonia hankookensis]
MPGLPSALRARFRIGAGNEDGDDEIIYLIAPSGHPNYGDELIALAWLQYLARARPHALVVLDCHSPGQTSLLLRGVHPGAVFVDTLWQLAEYAADTTRTDGPDPTTPWTWVAQAATTFGPAPRLAEGVDVFRRASSVHLLGGGYVNQVWPHHVSLVAAIAELTRMTGVPSYATGQGLIPLLDEPAWSVLTDAIGAFTVFDVRDEASAQALSGIGARRHTGDDAWLAVGEGDGTHTVTDVDDPDTVSDVDDPTRPPRHPEGVTLCLQSDLTDDFGAFGSTGVDALTRFIRATLDAWQVPAEAITVVEGIPGGDLEVPTRLGDRLDGATTVPFIDVWRKGLTVGRGDAWISTRFHPHLVAAAAGDPGVAVVTRPDYYATKHESLVAAGSRWTVVSGTETIPDRPTAGGFPEDARDRAVALKKALAQRIYPRRGRRSGDLRLRR